MFQLGEIGSLGGSGSSGTSGAPPVITPTAISLSATSINFVGTANANALVATITVTATGGTYAGPVTLGGTDAASFALSNGGVYPCNLLIGAANIPARSYSISLTATPVTQPFSIAVTLTAPAFVPTADGIAADIYMDFVNGNYWGASPAGPSPPAWTFSRNSVAWGDNAAGVWSQFAVNVPVITNKGLIVNPNATNLALQNRDMTQPAWVKTNMTAAKTQVGINGVANSASLLTATAANATVLQSITAASGTYITSFFLQRVTGTGTINITTDGGTTWTAVTLTTSFQRFFVNQAAVTNPSIGIRIVTSGDVVVADFAQCELQGSSAVPTSPIATSTAAVTRGTDMVNIPSTFGTAATIFAATTPFNGQIGSPLALSLNDNSNNNRLSVGRSLTTARGSIIIGGTATNIVFATTWADGVPGKMAGTATAGAQAACFNGGTPVTTSAAGYPAGLAQTSVGSFNGQSATWYVTSLATWLNHQSSNAALIAMTAATGTALTINLSTTSVTFPSGADANSMVAGITVTAAGGGTYVGVLTLGGTDAAKFALSNSGNYPCNLLVGPTNIAAGTYSISLTANP